MVPITNKAESRGPAEETYLNGGSINDAEVPEPKQPEAPKHEPEVPDMQPGKTNPMPEVPDTEIPTRENPIAPGDPHHEEEPERHIHTSRPDEPM